MSPIKTYLQVAGALFGLLVLTVAAAYVNLGPFNTVTPWSSPWPRRFDRALFMHVRRANPLIQLFVVAGFFWLGIMLTLTLSDFLTRHG